MISLCSVRHAQYSVLFIPSALDRAVFARHGSLIFQNGIEIQALIWNFTILMQYYAVKCTKLKITRQDPIYLKLRQIKNIKYLYEQIKGRFKILETSLNTI